MQIFSDNFVFLLCFFVLHPDITHICIRILKSYIIFQINLHIWKKSSTSARPFPSFAHKLRVGSLRRYVRVVRDICGVFSVFFDARGYSAYDYSRPSRQRISV